MSSIGLDHGHIPEHFHPNGLCQCPCADCTIRLLLACICPDCPCEPGDEHGTPQEELTS